MYTILPKKNKTLKYKNDLDPNLQICPNMKSFVTLSFALEIGEIILRTYECRRYFLQLISYRIIYHFDPCQYFLTTFYLHIIYVSFEKKIKSIQQ